MRISTRRSMVRAVALSVALVGVLTAAISTGVVAAFATTNTVSGTNGPIAFVRYQTCSTNTSDSGYQIYTINSNGSGLTDISNSVCSGYSDQYPSFSPNGSQIAFVRCCIGGVSQVFVMNADGSDQTQLGNGVFDQSGTLAWSPTGSQIAFHQSGELWKMNSDGSSPAAIPNTSGVRGTAPGISWSPNGTSVAFSAYYSGYSGYYGVYTVSPNGNNLTDVTSNVALNFEAASDWSPSGSQILSSVYYDCGYEDIWTVNANGSGTTDLTCQNSYLENAVWSP